MTRPATPPPLITLILLTGLSTVTLNLFVPALAQIAADLNTDYATASLSVSVYLGLTAILQLVLGPLADRIGRRPVLLGSIAVFTLASIGCALAPNVESFLIFRMLQGPVIAGAVLSLAIVRDTSSKERSAGIISQIGMAMALAPMLGPAVGGVLASAMGWRATFWAYAVMGAAIWILCQQNLRETLPQDQTATRRSAPRLSALLTDIRFWTLTACGAFALGAFFVFITGAPLVADAVFGISPAQLGMFVGSVTIGFIAGSAVATRISNWLAPHWMSFWGRIITCCGLAAGLLAQVTFDVPVVLYFAFTLFIGLGNGLTNPGTNASVLSLNPALAASAAGLKGAATVALGALLTALTGRILTPGNAELTFLLLLMAVALISLVFALWSLVLERRAERADALTDADTDTDAAMRQ